jgi:hypothetical protein
MYFKYNTIVLMVDPYNCDVHRIDLDMIFKYLYIWFVLELGIFCIRYMAVPLISDIVE